MKKIIKIGILGTGRVANHYFKLFKQKKIKGSKIVGVCDIKKKKLNLAAKTYNLKIFQNLESMLDQERPDLMIVLTPSGSHYDDVKFLLNKNFNVICEKPLAMKTHQCIELHKIAKKKKLMLGVVFQNRLNPAIEILRKYLKDKKFGKIVKVSVSLIWCRYQDYYNDGWHGTWKNDGGVTNQQAIHHLDVLNWLFGPIKKVNSITTSRANRLEAEDTMVSVIKLNNGALGTLEATTAARPNDLHASLSVVGTKGTAIIGGIALNKIKLWNIIGQNNKISKNIIKKYSQNVPNGYGLSHVKFLNLCLDNLRSKKKVAPVNAIDAINTQAVVQSIYKSNETQKWVKVSKNVKSKKLGN